jgi:hypothetical protein
MCKANSLKMKLPRETRIGEVAAMLLTASAWLSIVTG